VGGNQLSIILSPNRPTADSSMQTATEQTGQSTSSDNNNNNNSNNDSDDNNSKQLW
jgi:hypothetical protein